MHDSDAGHKDIEEDPVIIDLDAAYTVISLVRSELWEGASECSLDTLAGRDGMRDFLAKFSACEVFEALVKSLLDPREEESDATVRPTGDPGHSSSQGCS